jgi:hypothetical protein
MRSDRSALSWMISSWHVQYAYTIAVEKPYVE